MIGELVGLLSSADVRLLMLALAIYISSIFLAALRWTIASGAPLSKLPSFLEALLVGTFANNLISLSGAAGEATRVGWARLRTGLPLPRLLAGALAERAGDLLVGALYLLVALHAFSSVLLVSAHLRSLLGEAARAVRELASRPRLVMPLLALTLLIWLLDSLRILLVAFSFGVQASFPLAAALTLIGVLARLPPVPAGVGVLEGGYAGVMVAYGLSLGQAVSIILAERLITTVLPSVAGGAITIYRGGLGIVRALRGARLEDSLRD
ncbi:MAG: flippase-like domain-containing protein [Acidilobaceae archaeon]|nr:flippase-like domain-containing protein [Acidilobaceae archaeon]